MSGRLALVAWLGIASVIGGCALAPSGALAAEQGKNHAAAAPDPEQKPKAPAKPEKPAPPVKPKAAPPAAAPQISQPERPAPKKPAGAQPPTAPALSAPESGANSAESSKSAPAGEPEQIPAPKPMPESAGKVPPPPPPPANPFGFGEVRAKAKALASKPYEEPEGQLPDMLSNLSYDQYRDIRFKTDSALWRYDNVPFQVQFFHRGFLYRRKVDINAIVDGRALPIHYSPDLFDFGKNDLPNPPPSDLGFAGFRLHYPLKQPEYFDEFAVFLGASYFRAVGARNHYGLSARGLAIDTGLAKKEEFPVFREFWIQKPQPGDSYLTVYALLDSESVAGAYRFVIHPGLQTVMDVTADLFIRNEVTKFGVAPLTSMFFHGENTDRSFNDFRPEAHDSDGLLIDTGTEWIWRPLENPPRLQLSSFHAINPRGFGLLQRDRDFNNYQDLESAYQTRPSLWVTPVGDWGEGAIHLIEIPVDADKYDNIVAFWWPKDPVNAGDERQFKYRLTFTPDVLNRPPLGHVLATRVGKSHRGDNELFVIDFVDVAEPGSAGLQASISTSAGQIKHLTTYKNAQTEGWRTSFELVSEGDDPVELRGYLKSGDDFLTETWSYQWHR